MSSGLGIRPRQGKIDLPCQAPVFCCGDIAGGGTVTEAVGSGNRVVREAIAFLSDKPFIRKDKDEKCP